MTDTGKKDVTGRNVLSPEKSNLGRELNFKKAEKDLGTGQAISNHVKSIVYPMLVAPILLKGFHVLLVSCIMQAVFGTFLMAVPFREEWNSKWTLLMNGKCSLMAEESRYKRKLESYGVEST